MSFPEMVPVSQTVNIIAGYVCPLCGDECRGCATSFTTGTRRFDPCGCEAKEDE